MHTLRDPVAQERAQKRADSRYGRLNKRVLAIAGALIVLAAVAIVVLTQALQAGEAVWETVAYEKPISAVLVRKENVFNEERFSKVVFYAMEGTDVQQGQEIAKTYSWGYNERAMLELAEQQKKILDYQINTSMKDIIDPTLTTMNEDIHSLIEQIEDLTLHSGDADLNELQSQLSELMEERKQYLKGIVNSDDALEALYQQEQTLVERINSWENPIVASETGKVSYYFDGYEDVLTPDTLNDIQATDIATVLESASTQQLEESAEESKLYRLVDNQDWYCVTNITDAEMALESGDTYQMVFDGLPEMDYTAEVLSIRPGDASRILTLKMQTEIGPLYAVRHLNAVLRRETEAISVPVSALKQNEGQVGVYVIGDERTFVPVKILLRNDEKAAVEPLNANSPLQDGSKIAL